MPVGGEITFRRLRRPDFALLGGWLARPHVARWWNHQTDPESVERDFGTSADDAEPNQDWLVLLDGEPAGLLQYSRYDDYPEYRDELREIAYVPDGAASLDYLIGDPELTGHGLGSRMIAGFVQRIWRVDPDVPAVLVPVVAANTASWKALQRAGFRAVGRGELEPDNPVDEPLHVVLRIDRPRTGRATVQPAPDGPEAASALFGLALVGGPAQPVPGGRQGTVWRVDTADGPVALKQLTGPVDAAAVEADVRFQLAMARRGVDLPAPLPAAAGGWLARTGSGTWRAARWVDVAGPSRELDPAAVGELLAVLHRDPLPATGAVDPWYTAPVPDRAWRAAADNLAAAQAPFAAAFAADVPGFLAAQQVFRAPRDVQVCHRDLWTDNLRTGPDGRLCVLDWDNSGPAEAAQELAMPLAELCLDAPDRAAALYGAYRDAGGPGRLSEPGDFTMVLAQFGHFALTAAHLWLAATDDAGRADAEAWFAEGHDEPFGPAQVDSLLRVVTAL